MNPFQDFRYFVFDCDPFDRVRTPSGIATSATNPLDGFFRQATPLIPKR
jgi:hypothetical protein